MWRHRPPSSGTGEGLVSTELAPEREVFSFSAAVLPPGLPFCEQEGVRMPAKSLASTGTGREQGRDGDGRVAAIAIDL
jgi:hypothetical protein